MKSLQEKLTPNFEKAVWVFFLFSLIINVSLLWFSYNGNEFQKIFITENYDELKGISFFILCFGLFGLFANQGRKILILAIPLTVAALVNISIRNSNSPEGYYSSINNLVFFLISAGTIVLWAKANKFSFQKGIYLLVTFLLFIPATQNSQVYFGVMIQFVFSPFQNSSAELFSIQLFGSINAVHAWSIIFDVFIQTVIFGSFMTIFLFQKEKESDKWLFTYPKNIKISTGLFTLFLFAFQSVLAGCLITLTDGILSPAKNAYYTDSLFFMYLENFLVYTSFIAFCIVFRFVLRGYFHQRGEKTTIWIYLLNIPTLSWISLPVFLILRFLRGQNEKKTSEENVLDERDRTDPELENKKNIFPRRMIIFFQYGYLVFALIMLMSIPNMLQTGHGYDMDQARKLMDFSLLLILISFGMHSVIFKYKNGIYWILALQPLLHFFQWHFEMQFLGALVYGKIFELLFLNHFELFPENNPDAEEKNDNQNLIPITQTSST